MASPHGRQVSICLRKYNLEEIVNHFTNNLLPALPYLDEMMKQKVRKAMKALRQARVQDAEISQLKLKHGQLEAKRARLTQECNELMKQSERFDERIEELQQSMREEEIKQRDYMRHYAAEVEKVVNLNREYANIYDEEMVTRKTELLTRTILSEVMQEEKNWEDDVARKQKILDEMKPVVHKDILVIVGEKEIEEYLKKLSEEVDALKIAAAQYSGELQ